MRCEVIETRACQICGCTDDRACPGGCSWVSVDPPICSACIEPEASAAGEASGLLGAEHCPASATPATHMPIFVDGNSGYCVRCRQGFVS